MSTIIVGTPVTAGLGDLFTKHGLSKKTVVLFDKHTRNLFGDELLETLRHEGFQLIELVVPAREASKSFSVAYRLFGTMIEGNVDRSWNLLAIGGVAIESGGAGCHVELKNIKLHSETLELGDVIRITPKLSAMVTGMPKKISDNKVFPITIKK